MSSAVRVEITRRLNLHHCQTPAELRFVLVQLERVDSILRQAALVLPSSAGLLAYDIPGLFDVITPRCFQSLLDVALALPTEVVRKQRIADLKSKAKQAARDSGRFILVDFYRVYIPAKTLAEAVTRFAGDMPEALLQTHRDLLALLDELVAEFLNSAGERLAVARLREFVYRLDGEGIRGALGNPFSDIRVHVNNFKIRHFHWTYLLQTFEARSLTDRTKMVALVARRDPKSLVGILKKPGGIEAVFELIRKTGFYVEERFLGVSLDIMCCAIQRLPRGERFSFLTVDLEELLSLILVHSSRHQEAGEQRDALLAHVMTFAQFVLGEASKTVFRLPHAGEPEGYMATILKLVLMHPSSLSVMEAVFPADFFQAGLRERIIFLLGNLNNADNALAASSRRQLSRVLAAIFWGDHTELAFSLIRAADEETRESVLCLPMGPEGKTILHGLRDSTEAFNQAAFELLAGLSLARQVSVLRQSYTDNESGAPVTAVDNRQVRLWLKSDTSRLSGIFARAVDTRDIQLLVYLSDVVGNTTPTLSVIARPLVDLMYYSQRLAGFCGKQSIEGAIDLLTEFCQNLIESRCLASKKLGEALLLLSREQQKIDFWMGCHGGNSFLSSSYIWRIRAALGCVYKACRFLQSTLMTVVNINDLGASDNEAKKEFFLTLSSENPRLLAKLLATNRGFTGLYNLVRNRILSFAEFSEIMRSLAEDELIILLETDGVGNNTILHEARRIYQDDEAMLSLLKTVSTSRPAVVVCLLYHAIKKINAGLMPLLLQLLESSDQADGLDQSLRFVYHVCACLVTLKKTKKWSDVFPEELDILIRILNKLVESGGSLEHASRLSAHLLVLSCSPAQRAKVELCLVAQDDDVGDAGIPKPLAVIDQLRCLFPDRAASQDILINFLKKVDDTTLLNLYEHALRSSNGELMAVLRPILEGKQLWERITAGGLPRPRSGGGSGASACGIYQHSVPPRNPLRTRFTPGRPPAVTV